MGALEAKFVSHLDAVMKDIVAGETKQRKRAASFLRSKIRQKARAHKDTGEYSKGIYVKNSKGASFVGVKSPHAFLVEFGTEARTKTSTGQSVGRMPAQGIVYGTFAENAAAAEQIMSEPYIK